MCLKSAVTLFKGMALFFHGMELVGKRKHRDIQRKVGEHGYHDHGILDGTPVNRRH